MVVGWMVAADVPDRQNGRTAGWFRGAQVTPAPIVGPRTVEQLARSLRALEITLSDETLQRLDEIWLGPGGAAPNAYAW